MKYYVFLFFKALLSADRRCLRTGGLSLRLYFSSAFENDSDAYKAVPYYYTAA